MGVSQELLYEFRTVQVVLGFPRVFCTAVRVNRRRERQFLLRWINGLHNQTVQMTGSATSHSLSEALPLQEVLHSPIRDSAANYFFNHKLLDNCSLLSLPLFGSLLLSHSATIENKRMNEGQGNHKNREFISFRAKKKPKLNTVESGTFTFISLLLGFFFSSRTWQWRLLCCALHTMIGTLVTALHLLFLSGDCAPSVQKKQHVSIAVSVVHSQPGYEHI